MKGGSFCGSCGHWSHIMSCKERACGCILTARPVVPQKDEELICFKCRHRSHGREPCTYVYRDADGFDNCPCKMLTLHLCDVPEAPGRVDALVGPEDQEGPDRAS